MVIKAWKVKIERPEEILGKPELFYTDEEVEKYAKSGSMRRAQQKIAYRILQILKVNPPASILDLGCGVGYTAEVYLKEGFDVTGLDILPNMLSKAKQKQIKVVQEDMRNLKAFFKNEKFDFVVSASALQWIKNKEDLKKVADGIKYILKEHGKVVIQFYPYSEEEMIQIAKIFKKAGFKTEIIIDSPENPKKRTIFLVGELE